MNEKKAFNWKQKKSLFKSVCLDLMLL